MLQRQSLTTRAIASAAALIALLLFLRPFRPAAPQHAGAQARRNVVIFVADGLRPGSITVEDMPALSRLRAAGVEFRNSHAVFPTFTMPNASAIATGHGLADTSTFSNTVWIRYAVFGSGNFRAAPGSPVPYLENDRVLADLDDHYDGNFVGEETLLELARRNGYNTAAVGKVGPTAMQAVSSLAPRRGVIPEPITIIVDDSTGTSAGIPLRKEVVQRLLKEGLSADAPTRSNGYGPASAGNNGYSGDKGHGGTLMANDVQQQWFADVTTRALLPIFEQDAGKPFALVFWSRDPDGTQHNQGDSLHMLVPGINGGTSRLALRNVDRNLRQLLDWLDGHPSVKANTDVVVTSDHGFATISRREIDRSGRATASEAAKHPYVDATGKPDTDTGMMPYGFLAIDLALDLHLDLFDPDRRLASGGDSPFKKLRLGPDPWEHPAAGNGLIGRELHRPDGSDAMAIVTANGGSDLVYVPGGDVQSVRRIVSLLLGYDYVGGLFVDDKYGAIPGTLPLSAIGLQGSGALPRPDIVVAFKVFYLSPEDLQSAVQVSDTLLQEGQGTHGGFGRDSTYNTMIAWGPDFKRGFVDTAPASNADLAPTLAQLLGLKPAPKGTFQGRVLREAFIAASESSAGETRRLASTPANGLQTVIYYQELGGTRYVSTACLWPEARAAQATPAACRQ
jgi:arylsulfatase A-like enzyme